MLNKILMKVNNKERFAITKMDEIYETCAC